MLFPVVTSFALFLPPFNGRSHITTIFFLIFYFFFFFLDKIEDLSKPLEPMLRMSGSIMSERWRHYEQLLLWSQGFDISRDQLEFQRYLDCVDSVEWVKHGGLYIDLDFRRVEFTWANFEGIYHLLQMLHTALLLFHSSSIKQNTVNPSASAEAHSPEDEGEIIPQVTYQLISYNF